MIKAIGVAFLWVIAIVEVLFLWFYLIMTTILFIRKWSGELHSQSIVFTFNKKKVTVSRFMEITDLIWAALLVLSIPFILISYFTYLKQFIIE